MNRVRVVTAVLSAIAFVTLAVPYADAGGGMGLGSGTISCRAVQGGPNPPQVVSLTDPFAPNTVVQVGPAALICVGLQSEGTPPSNTIGDTVGGGPPTVAPQSPNGLVCYPVLGSDKQKFTAFIDDAFTLANGPSQTVTIAGVSLLCVDAAIAFPQQ
jgi:hypothetical protein